MDDIDGEFEKVVFPPKLPNTINLDDSKKTCRKLRQEPLNESKYLLLRDDDGRIINKHALKEAVFRGTLCILCLLISV